MLWPIIRTILLIQFQWRSHNIMYLWKLWKITINYPDTLIWSTKSPTVLPYLSGYKTGLCPSRMTSNNQISPMKFWYDTNFTLPKQSQRSRSILQDGSRSFRLFWKEKTLSYNRRNTVPIIPGALRNCQNSATDDPFCIYFWLCAKSKLLQKC